MYHKYFLLSSLADVSVTCLTCKYGVLSLDPQHLHKMLSTTVIVYVDKDRLIARVP